MNDRGTYRTRLATGALLLGLFLIDPGAVPAGAGEKAADAAEAPRSQFIILLQPARTGKAATESDKAKITEHFDYLKRLLAEGNLLLAGLSTDDYRGIVVIRARDRLDAERIMASDPAVGANVFLAELHPFQVALMLGAP